MEHVTTSGGAPHAGPYHLQELDPNETSLAAPGPTPETNGHREAPRPPAAGRGPARLYLIMVAVALLFVGLGLWFFGHQQGAGPLKPPTGFTNVSFPLDVGQPSTVAITLPAYGGTKPLVLRSVTPISPDSGIRIVGERVLLPGQNAGRTKSGPGFPPAGATTHPLPGWAYRQGQGPIQVLVGVKTVDTGISAIQGFSLRYTWGGRTYSAAYLSYVAICAPISRYPTCDIQQSPPGV